jgi:predicted RNA-binding Zn-ribbon protein involved in translation (DUF1610 family)
MSRTSYYHVCSSCDAKFFTPHSVHLCPRCGQLSASSERLVPPWQAEQDLSKEAEEEQQKQYLRAHIAQLRARQCPGCGETELF